MNPDISQNRTTLAYVAGILGAFLIVAALVWAMHRYTQPPALDQDRAAARSKALAELRAAEGEALSTPGWIDQSKGLVRLRIEDAMEMVIRDWGKDPGAARSNLVARVEKATALPPKAPEKPSQYE
jgi:hypothetical protein